MIEYFGPGVEQLSCTGMGTICNMGAEVGATSSVFPLTNKMLSYLRATGRKDIADYIQQTPSVKKILAADEGPSTPRHYLTLAHSHSLPIWVADVTTKNFLLGCHYDKVIDIDLDSLEPHINGPFSPDIATPLSKMKDAAAQHGWPETIRVFYPSHTPFSRTHTI